jgi:hypothetical protein
VSEESADTSDVIAAFEVIKGLPAPDHSAPLRNAVEEQLHGLLWSEANEVGPTTRPRKLKANDITQMTGLFQPRDGLDESHVMTLFRTIRDKAPMEPVLILAVGTKYVLLDGHHRVAAYEALKQSVPVSYYKGSVMDAVLDSAAENTKARKQVTRDERMNHAWKLVKLTAPGNPDEPMYSKAQIRKASSVSVRQVAYMRSVHKALGNEALKYAVWDEAAAAAKGKVKTRGDDDDWLEQWAMRNADRIAPLKLGISNNPEAAALTMLHVMGRNFEDFAKEVKALARLPEREKRRRAENPFGDETTETSPPINADDISDF